jgi:hypothetical protein
MALEALDGGIKDSVATALRVAGEHIKQVQKIGLVSPSILTRLKQDLHISEVSQIAEVKKCLPALKKLAGVTRSKTVTSNMFSKFEEKQPKVSTLLAEAIKELRLK